MDTWEPVLHNPGSWLWQSSRKVSPVSQFKLWWLLSCVRDSQGRRLDEGHPPRAGWPQTVPGLESQKLLAGGTRRSNREPGCLTTLLQQTACGFPRFAGEGGRRWRPGCQCHTNQGSQDGPCPMYNSPQRKTVAGPEFLPGLGPQTPGRTSPHPWRNGPTKAP